MNKVQTTLFKIGVLKLSVGKVKKWTKQKNVGNLIYALEHGLYKVREAAAIGLGELKAAEALPNLTAVAVNDDIESVTLAAINAIEEIGIPQGLEPALVSKLKHWQRKEDLDLEARKKQKRKVKDLPTWDKRGRMQRLEQLRQMLKKPIKFW